MLCTVWERKRGGGFSGVFWFLLGWVGRLGGLLWVGGSLGTSGRARMIRHSGVGASVLTTGLRGMASLTRRTGCASGEGGLGFVNELWGLGG